jgi:phosphomannomutase
VLEELVDKYMESIVTLRTSPGDNTVYTAAPKVCYTAMHGVGRAWIERALTAYGFPMDKVVYVQPQEHPDPEFTTVVFPNPEEKGALDLALQWAKDNNCDVVIANDPDADRLAVVEWQPASSSWQTFSGNEMGVLLGQWAIRKYKGAGGDPTRAACIASIVSSRMLKAVASKEGVQYYDTLTGFKWIGNKGVDLSGATPPTTVLFGYEEALGYAFGDLVFDKDGVSAAAVLLEMASILRTKYGRTLSQQLEQLRETYGNFASCNNYVISRDNSVTDKIFVRLREGGADGRYIREYAGVSISSIKDVTMGYDSASADNKLDIPATPGSNMLMFDFANGVSFTLRTSGTEPKIKFYTEMPAAQGQSREAATDYLTAFVRKAVNEMLQPEANGLDPF